MDVSIILTYVFGGTTLVSIATTVIFWKLFKRQKLAETKAAEEDTEAKNLQNETSKLDLGDRYIESIIKLEDTFKGNTAAVDRLSGKIDKVLTEQERHNRILGAIRSYLNGDFDAWLQEHGITLESTIDNELN